MTPEFLPTIPLDDPPTEDPDSVTVTTGARLHFGPLASSGTKGGKFGGAGMMVSAPNAIVVVRRADRDVVVGTEAQAVRVNDVLNRLRAADRKLAGTPLSVEVRESIPSHCGFGSGTQLSLAVARAVREYAADKDVSAETLARQSGRGLRSAIGLHGFAHGGFLVDGGRSREGELGTLVARVPVPDEWRLILARPRETEGLSGERERQAFASQSPMPASLTAQLCQILLMEWLPGLVQADFPRASAAMFAFGSAVGAYFEPTQGGVFAHPRMRTLAEQLHSRGVTGIAQTSWGPTLAILCPDTANADEIHSDFASDGHWQDCHFQIVTPLNHGARIERA